MHYIGTLATHTVSSANVARYAEIVRESARLRKLIAVGAEIQDQVFEPNGRTAGELVAEAERRLFEIAASDSRSDGRSRDMRAVLPDVVDRIETAFQAGGQIIGLPTGFEHLDAKTSGLEPGQLVILAGRPSSGKTALAINFAENVAVRQGRPTAVFSLEMSASEIGKRTLSSVGCLNFQRLRSGSLHEDEWPHLTAAVNTLSAAPLHLDDTPALSPAELRSRARKAHREHGPLALVIVDYLGLMRVPGIRADNRVAEVTEISRSLKTLAKELSVPVLACAQLNRGVEQRTNKRPIMSDLRDSGAIEQDADLILFVYRDEVYDEHSPRKGIAEIIIGKQRNGPVGTVYLMADLSCMRFYTFIGELPDARPIAKVRNLGGAKGFEYQ